jgi:HD-like signal output (HDOD) protein
LSLSGVGWQEVEETTPVHNAPPGLPERRFFLAGRARQGRLARKPTKSPAFGRRFRRWVCAVRPTMGLDSSPPAVPAAMSVNPELRKLDIDIPSQPQALLQLSLLLADDDINLQAAASLIEGDMALAAAVMKAVNSSLYGLKGRVQSVQQAITYLGMREVAAITFEMGLRAAFPPAPELEPIWARAAWRGQVMARLAQRLALDAWGAHSAGLFEECGKAVLFRHAPDHYRAMLRAAPDDRALAELERTGFGVSHDALGAALCESWGLGLAAVSSVRHHVLAQATHELPPPPARRGICALSVLAHLVETEAEQSDETAASIAQQAELDPDLVLRALRRELEQRAEAEAHGRS